MPLVSWSIYITNSFVVLSQTRTAAAANDLRRENGWSYKAEDVGVAVAAASGCDQPGPGAGPVL
jgi:hypothetical protein